MLQYVNCIATTDEYELFSFQTIPPFRVITGFELTFLTYYSCLVKEIKMRKWGCFILESVALRVVSSIQNRIIIDVPYQERHYTNYFASDCKILNLLRLCCGKTETFIIALHVVTRRSLKVYVDIKPVA